MQVFRNLGSDMTGSLEEYRRWVMSADVRGALEASLAKRAKASKLPDDLEEPCSDEYLRKLDHGNHVGFPIHMYGIDLNYRTLQSHAGLVDASMLEEIRRRDLALDDRLQNYLGAKTCALKAYYPAGGHIGWHNNWNAPGYNIIFTYSGRGDGYWKHVTPTAASEIEPDLSRLLRVPDSPGWHCKVGYFGSKRELDRVVWHCAYTNEPRLTVSYIIYDEGIWQNMVNEIADGAETMDAAVG